MAKMRREDRVESDGPMEVLPSGKYFGCVVGFEAKTTKKGDAATVLDFAVFHPKKGRIKFQYYMLEGKGNWRTWDLADAIDAELPDVDWQDRDDMLEHVIGKPVGLSVVKYNDTYKGETKERNKVDRHHLLSGKSLKALEKAFGKDITPDWVADAIEEFKNAPADAGYEDADSGGSGNFSDDEIPF